MPDFTIVSGGQTGVDRAALDVGLRWGIPVGGWCPRGRKAEDGKIPARYPLQETESAQYAVRTKKNVADSEATLILALGTPTGGTALTVDIAEKLHKPLLVVDLDLHPDPQSVCDWIRLHSPKVLNIAGPRESTTSGVGEQATQFLEAVLELFMEKPQPRKGARRRADIPSDILTRLNSGELETANLVEGLAIDFDRLLRTAFPQIGLPDDVDLSADAPVTQRMQSCGRLLLSNLGLERLDDVAGHSADTVRGWAAYMIGLAEGLTFSQRLKRIQPLADDPHFGVREWAWIALRPHLADDITATIIKLTPWTRRRSENLRRFACEATRPRGVWCTHISELKEKPELALPLLEPLRNDSSKYVQDSVANWLNDASKTRPEWVVTVCQRWQQESPTKSTMRICQRGQRSIES